MLASAPMLSALRGGSRTRLTFVLAGAAACASSSCQDTPSRATIGPQGGLIASEDDGLTIVLWPGALGQYETFEIVASDMAPASYGQAYRVRPNVALGVDAEIILRGDLPANESRTRIGALDASDVAAGSREWTRLPHRRGAIDSAAGSVHSHDGQIALYYAMLDDGRDGDDTTATATASDTDPDDSSSGDPDPTATPTTTSYAADIAPLWAQGCVDPNCHGTPPSGGLTLTGDSYGALVNAQATINGAYTRVIPGDPAGSLLLQKLTSTQPADAGTPMPPTGPVPQAAIDLVRLWIEEDCPP